MSAVLLPLASIGAIAVLAWVAQRTLGARLCPICTGVAGTWVWMLIAAHLDGGFDSSMLPFLMGGSVVGVAYQVERWLPAGRPARLWKSFAIPIGLVAAYALAHDLWTLLGVALAAALGLAMFLRHRAPAPSANGEAVAKLEAQMKQCC